MEEQENKVIIEPKPEKKSVNLKRIIRISTISLGVVLIIFSSFFNASFDFTAIDWRTWLTNAIFLLGIMLFGIFMGQGMGEDFQKNKVGGMYQNALSTYKQSLMIIEGIKIYFSQWWLWFKEKQLKEKKMDYLIEHGFDARVAQVIVNNIKKEEVENLIYQGAEKIYVKADDKGRLIKIKKLDEKDAQFVINMFDITLDTYSDSYYLTLYDDGDTRVKLSEKGKKIDDKIKKDKIVNYALKITSSFIISIIWAALTINEFMDDEMSKKLAWINFFSRLFGLVTSLFSGFATSVINVRDQARAIDSKSDVLKEYKITTDNQLFIPETYEEMIEREYREQEEL